MLTEIESAEGRDCIDDAVLVDRVRGGDHAAFAELYERHYSRVSNLALQLAGDQDSAAEIAQATFTNAYRSIGSVRDGQALRKFLYRTVVNLVRDRSKSARRKPWTSLTDLLRGNEFDIAAQERNPEERLIDSTLARELQRALANLPLEFREVVVLHHYHEMDIRAIAESLAIPEGTVKSRLGRGRRRLREELKEWLDE